MLRLCFLLVFLSKAEMVRGEEAIVGSRGPPGFRGAPGVRGEPGLSGPPGVRGEPGFSGPPGVRGEPGVLGPPGVRGEPWLSGTPGVRGEPGRSGPIGPVGPPGRPGLPGPMGLSGRDGELGPIGEPGRPGLTGQPGTCMCNLEVLEEEIKKVKDHLKDVGTSLVNFAAKDAEQVDSSELPIDSVDKNKGCKAAYKGTELLTSYGRCGVEEMIPNTDHIVVAGGWQTKMTPEDLIRVVPWHVGVYAKTYTPYKQICGGTIVSGLVVVSAAHCFWDDLTKKQPAGNYAVAAGKIYRPYNNPYDVFAQERDVKDIRIPPRFQGAASNFQDDIALLVLTDRFHLDFSVKPVCLDFSQELEKKILVKGNPGKLAGWGLTGEDAPAAPTLNLVHLPYVDIEDCIKDSPQGFVKAITSDKICAGHTNGTAVCRGDSGGGLAFKEYGRYYLRGVVSSAPSNDHKCNIYTWATFTDVGKHEMFIRDLFEELGEY